MCSFDTFVKCQLKDSKTLLKALKTLRIQWMKYKKMDAVKAVNSMQYNCVATLSQK